MLETLLIEVKSKRMKKNGIEVILNLQYISDPGPALEENQSSILV